jgi:hypothetical protein
VDAQKLEMITDELVGAYDIQAPPVPIESMLQRPLHGMWEELDITKLSSSFINVNDYYSPRMSLARLLARHIVGSDWGKERGLNQIAKDDEQMRAFARMLIMPSSLVRVLSATARTPEWMSVHFEVPTDDADIRLQELKLKK